MTAPPAQQAEFWQMASTREDSERVQVEGVVRSVGIGGTKRQLTALTLAVGEETLDVLVPGDKILVIQSSDVVVRAEPYTPGVNQKIKTLRPGSLLQLTGIAQVRAGGHVKQHEIL